MKLRLGYWLLVVGLFTIMTANAMTQENQRQKSASLEPFKVEYAATYVLGWLNLNIVGYQKLSLLENGLWQLEFEAETPGANLSESSVFRLQEGQITPLEYRYATGGLLRKSPQHQRFDADKQTIEDVANQQEHADLWQPSLQDNLTYILQASLDLMAGKTDLQYHFYHKGGIKSYHYQVVGKEALKTAMGEISTIKLQRMDSQKRTIYAWFAVDYQYRLVRLAELKDGKVAYEINAVNLK